MEDLDGNSVARLWTNNFGSLNKLGSVRLAAVLPVCEKGEWDLSFIRKDGFRERDCCWSNKSWQILAISGRSWGSAIQHIFIR